MPKMGLLGTPNVVITFRALMCDSVTACYITRSATAERVNKEQDHAEDPLHWRDGSACFSGSLVFTIGSGHGDWVSHSKAVRSLSHGVVVLVVLSGWRWSHLDCVSHVWLRSIPGVPVVWIWPVSWVTVGLRYLHWLSHHGLWLLVHI
ncbi:unnamed protein product [Moneuplotes crassus]|uniref:Uncharacterized protein n=1 Tax=Euplotes crassus TaxID=5936 RepID=A0AAD1Y338_EUPCR|nr:unnamed protein product [Moneuplotes crassus]